MRKANLLFDVLYFVGIGLAFLSFYTFVPEASRTRVAWLDFGICLLIYTGYLGRLMALFRPLVKFADAVPFFTTYWAWWGTYVAFSVSGMVVFHFLDMAFRKQALLQGIMFFIFMNVVVFGIWGAAWMARSSRRDSLAIGGVREIQHKASALRIAAGELPMTYALAKRDVEKILDDLNCIAGSGNAQAIALEQKIGALMERVNSEMLDMVPEDELARSLKELRMTIAMRKAI